MQYSLIEGLAALACFEVAMMVNTTQYRFTRRIIKKMRRQMGVDEALFCLASACGLAYLGGIIGHIVLNSDLMVDKWSVGLIGIGLALPFLIPYLSLFGDLAGVVSKKRPRSWFMGIICSMWSGLFVGFMLSNTAGYALAMAIFAVSLPPVLLTLAPLSNRLGELRIWPD